MTDEEIGNARRLLDSAIEGAQRANRTAMAAVLADEADETRQTLAHVIRALADLERLRDQLEAVWAS